MECSPIMGTHPLYIYFLWYGMFPYHGYTSNFFTVYYMECSPIMGTHSLQKKLLLIIFICSQLALYVYWRRLSFSKD